MLCHQFGMSKTLFHLLTFISLLFSTTVLSHPAVSRCTTSPLFCKSPFFASSRHFSSLSFSRFPFTSLPSSHSCLSEDRFSETYRYTYTQHNTNIQMALNWYLNIRSRNFTFSGQKFFQFSHDTLCHT